MEAIKLDTCFECGQPAKHQHHVIPKSFGGLLTVPLCELCHGLVHGIDFTDHSNIIRIGLKAAQAKGIKLGAPVKATDELINLMKSLREDGMSFKKIARLLNVSVGLVHKHARQVLAHLPASFSP